MPAYQIGWNSPYKNIISHSVTPQSVKGDTEKDYI